MTKSRRNKMKMIFNGRKAIYVSLSQRRDYADDGLVGREKRGEEEKDAHVRYHNR